MPEIVRLEVRMPVDNLTRREARQRAAQIGDVAYRLELSLSADPGEATFESVTEITFTSAETSPTFLNLTASAVDRVELNGQRLDAEAGGGDRVQLSGVRAGKNRVRVVARCAYSHTGVGLHRAVDPVDEQVYVYTHFEPFDAHKMFACFDQPDIKGTFEIAVSAPREWTVVSNSPVASTDPAAEKRQRVSFEVTPLLSTYLAAVVAGPLHHVGDRHHDIELGLYCRRSLAEHLDPAEIFEITRQGLDYYAELFGIPYPFSKYDQLMVPEFNMGAMENPGCVTFNEIFVFRSKVTESARSRRANVILHEMAHMWFGDLVTMRWWDDLWLNESFATFMATLSQVEATRFTGGWVDFANTLKANAARQDQLPSTHPIAADMVDTEAVRLNFDGITYSKGASVLRQLVAWVGQDALVEGLRAYFRDHRWANAELRDFLNALERSSGRNLASWSREWLETPGMSVIRPEVSVDDNRYATVSLLQEGAGPTPTLRSHRIALGLYTRDPDGALVRTRRLELDIVGERTDIAELRGEPVPDLLLVNDEDLTFAKVRLDERSRATLVESLSGLRDPLARAVCWANAWDMTRDAELPTRDYVAMVARHALAETEVVVLERLLLQVGVAIDQYGAPANRGAARAQVASAARGALESVEPGGDLQLVWTRALVASARAEGDLAMLAGLLDGEQTVPGLAVDTDLRWLIVTRLAAAGRDDAVVLIEAEERRDPTDIGRRRALTARTSRPDAEAKAAAWRLAAEESGQPLQSVGAAIGGFDIADQEDLTAAYLERYAASVVGWWRDRSVDEAQLLTRGLFPVHRRDQTVLAVADRLLADDSLPPPAHRIVLESRDGVVRARRTRIADLDPSSKESRS